MQKAALAYIILTDKIIGHMVEFYFNITETSVIPDPHITDIQN